MKPLASQGYTLPGTVIGQIITPKAPILPADIRIPVYVGKGDRLALSKNANLLRGYIDDESVSFSTSYPHTATLQHNSNQKKDVAELAKADGTIVRDDLWQFTSQNSIVIATDAYDPSADYVISYQSTDRSVLDKIPVADIRGIRAVGTQEDTPMFKENEDYYVVTSLSNANKLVGLNADATVILGGSNVGSYLVSKDASFSYTHKYNRTYNLAVTAKTGNNVTFEWSSTASVGNNALPATPIHSTLPKPTFVVDTSALPAVVTLELGVVLSFTSVTTATVGDTLQVEVEGAALIEADARLHNTNQYLTVSPVVKQGTSVITLDVDATSYSEVRNSSVVVKVVSKVSNDITIAWAVSGDNNSSGQFVMDCTNPAQLTHAIGSGLVLKFSDAVVTSSDFNVDTTWTASVLAPRIFPSAKDTRTITLQVSATNATSAAGGFSSNTVEGGFGTWTSDNAVSAGYFSLPGNLSFVVRNRSNLVVGDKFSFEFINEGYLSWELNAKEVRQYLPAQLLLDKNGSVTGQAGRYWVNLEHTPISVTISGGVGTWIAGSTVVYFASKPNSLVTITYEHKGKEPSLGQRYYFSSLHLRPSNLFNSVQIVTSLDAGETLLAPSTLDNDLFVMNKLAWSQSPRPKAVAYIQVKDADEDGVITSEDVRLALQALSADARLTDYLLIGQSHALSQVLAINTQNNDPFEKKENCVWFGAPIDTAVGSEAEEKTLVFYAQTTMRVYGDSPAHGTRLMVAPTWAKATMRLDDGSVQQTTVDGSFVAGAVAAMNAGMNPTDTLLRKQLYGFDEIQTYDEPVNKQLGGNGIIFFSSQGSGIYRIDENVTTDLSSEDFNTPEVTMQRQAVTKDVRKSMDLALIGFTADNPQAGVGYVTGVLSEIMIRKAGLGDIAAFQDEATGSVRPFDPNVDIKVQVRAGSKSSYNFWYSFYTKSAIKRLFGGYVLNQGLS